jgi:HK97 family phage major capsid protein
MGFSDLITATGTDPLIPTEQSTDIIKIAGEKSLAMSLGRRLPNLSRGSRTLKVEDTLASVYMVNGPSGTTAPGLKQTSDTSWRDVVLTAEELAVVVVIGQNQLDDAMVPIWPEVKDQIAAKMAKAVDEAAFVGTVGGVAVWTSWPTGGIRTHAVNAGNTVAFPTGVDLYADLLGTSGIFSLVEADGYEVNGVVGAISMQAALRDCRDGLGNPIFHKDPSSKSIADLYGAPMYFPKNGALSATTGMLLGDWSQFVYAVRQDLSYTIATEGVISDAAGNIVVNLFQQDSVALRAVLRIGIAVPNPVNMVQETTASRSPFGVVTI